MSKTWRRALSLLLMLCILTGMLPATAWAADVSLPGGASPASTEEEELPYQERVENYIARYGDQLTEEEKSQLRSGEVKLEDLLEETNPKVRVIIELEGQSALEADPSSLTLIQEAAESGLGLLSAEDEQQIAAQSIAAETGVDLDVKYTYDLAFNGIAAEVNYLDMDAIAQADGVASVYIDPTYELVPTNAPEVSPNMSGSNETTGVNAVSSQYKGEGTVIAVIDTGLDLDHEAFQNAGGLVTEENAGLTKAVLAGIMQNLSINGLTGADANSVYKSLKVPFAFNYADDGKLPADHTGDSQGDHGTHVAGIAAGYMVDGEGKVTFSGAAPAAQLIIMKAFGKDRAGQWSDILAAMEDAALLGADVINLSLGSPAGFSSSSSAAEQNTAEVFATLSAAGVVVCASAGNEYTAAYGNRYGDMSLASNPDNGIVGSPASYDESLAVASVANTTYSGQFLWVGDRKIAFTNNASVDSRNILKLIPEGQEEVDQQFAILTDGTSMLTGTAGDFEQYAESSGIAGKFVVVRRGETFTETVQRAQDAGAIGLIVADHSEGSLSNMAENLDVKIPSVFISKADGDFLESQKTGTITISKAISTEANVGAGQMSDFSSWGVTSDLKLKPEITTPGGNIYSTRDNGTYGNMSGTSMASPNMAGLAALAKQYINENQEKFAAYINTDGQVDPGKLSDLITNLMMSTASPITDPNNDTFYSPRKQGAGLASIANAVAGEAFLTVEGAHSAKLDLGDDDGKTGVYTMTFTINSLSGEAEHYTLDTTALTEKILKDQQVEYQTYHWDEAQQKYTTETITEDFMSNEPYELTGVTVSYAGNDVADGTVTVPANGSTTVTVTLTLGDADRSYLEQYPNGIYVDGFVQMLDADGDDGADLSIPFLAFYGDWEQAPILDEGTWMDVLEDNPIYPSNGFSTAKRDLVDDFIIMEMADPLGMPSNTEADQRELAEYAYDYRPSLNLFNPAEESVYKDLFCDVSLLRNAKDLTMTIYGVKEGTTKENLDDYQNLEQYVDTGTVYNTITGENYNKSYYDSGSSVMRDHSDYLSYRFYWDGTDSSGALLADGTMVIGKLTASLGTGDDESGNQRSSFYFPVVIHITPAKVTEMGFTTDPVGTYVDIDDPDFVGSVQLQLYGTRNEGEEGNFFTMGELMGYGGDEVPERMVGNGGRITFDFPNLWDSAYNIWTIGAVISDLTGNDTAYYYHFISQFSLTSGRSTVNQGQSMTLNYTTGITQAYSHWLENSSVPGGKNYTVTSSDPDLLRVTDNGDGTITATASTVDGLTQAKKVDVILRAGVNQNYEKRLTVTVLPYLLQKEIDEAQPGGTVYWTGGDLTDSVIIDKDLTLDLGGAALTAVGGQPAINVQGGNVTICNGTISSSADDLPTSGTGLLTTLEGEYPAAVRAEGGSVTLDSVLVEGAALTGQALETYVSSAVDLIDGADLTIRSSELYGEYAVNNKVTGSMPGGTITAEDGYLSGDVASVKDFQDADTVVGLEEHAVAMDSDAIYTQALSDGTAVNDLSFTGNFFEQSATPYFYFDLSDPEEVAKWSTDNPDNITISYENGKMKVTSTGTGNIIRTLDTPVSISGTTNWKAYNMVAASSYSAHSAYVNVGGAWKYVTNLATYNNAVGSGSVSGTVTQIRIGIPATENMTLDGIGAFRSADDAANYTQLKINTSTKALTVVNQSALETAAELVTAQADGQLTVTAPEPVTVGGDKAFGYRWIPVSVTMTPAEGEAQTAEFTDGTAVLDLPEGAYTLSVNWAAEVAASALRQEKLDRLKDPEYSTKAAADMRSYLTTLCSMLDLDAAVSAISTLKANLEPSMVKAAFTQRDAEHVDSPLSLAGFNENYTSYAAEAEKLTGDENGVKFQGAHDNYGFYWAKSSTTDGAASKTGYYAYAEKYVKDRYNHLTADLTIVTSAQAKVSELKRLCDSGAGLAELQAWWGANGESLLDTATTVQKAIKADNGNGEYTYSSSAAWDSVTSIYYLSGKYIFNKSGRYLWEFLDGDGVTAADGSAVNDAMSVLKSDGNELYSALQAVNGFFSVTNTQRKVNLAQQNKTQDNGKTYAENLLAGIAANASAVYALHEADGKQYLSAQGSGQMTYAAVELTSDHGQPAVQTLCYPAGAQITLPTLTASGWTHTGWTDGEHVYDLKDLYTVPAEGAALTAVWEAGSVSYTLELYGADLTGGTYTSLGTVTVPAYAGQEIQLVQEGQLTLPEAEGMPDLSGFLFDADHADNVLTATVTGDSTTVLKVYFDRAAFTLTAGEDTAQVLFGASLMETLNTFTPVKEGYTFGGWYLDETLETAVGEDAVMPAQALTVYPKWTVQQSTITFVTGEGATQVAPITQEYGTAVTKPDDPTREGYTFTGWFTDEACQNVYTFTTMPAEDLTLYAGWQAGQYTLQFNSNGGSDAASIVADYGAPITLPTVTRAGYTFGGWYRDSGLSGQPVEFTTMPAENLTLYAKWTANRYTITFETGEGSAVEPITADYGSAVSAPDEPTRAGCTFGGWYTDPDCTGEPYVFTTMPLDGLTLYAKWTANSVTLTFDTGAGGPAVEPITGSYGSPVTLPAPEKTGYTFGGWYREPDCTGEAVELTAMPAESATLYAKWTVNQYTITFVTGEGSAVEPIVADYGSAVSAPDEPTRAGYTFAGWYTEEACENLYTFTTMPAGNVTLYAKWTVNSVTITFHSNGGSAVEPISGAFGTAVKEPDYPVLKGHSFLGWFTQEDLSGERYVFETMPAENLDLYAKWVLNQYRVSFETDGGTELADLMVDYGTLVPEPQAPVKSGYFFQGWTLDGQPYDFSTPMPDTNLVLTAVWVKDSALQKLIDEAEAGSTVTWTGGDFTTSVVIDKPITLDLGGAVITGLAGEPVITSMPGAGQTVTIQNGTLTAGSDQGQPALLVDGGTTVLRNMLCRGDSVEKNGTVIYNGSGADVHNNGNLTVYDSVLAGIYGINNGSRGSQLGGGQIQLHSAVLLGLANDLYSDDTLLVPGTSLTLPEQDFSAQLREGDLPEAVEELGQMLTVRRERIVIPKFQSSQVETSYAFRDGMLEVTVTVPEMAELAFASRWVPVLLENGSQSAEFTQQADGTFRAALPADGGAQNCTIRFQGQLSFSGREMEQIVNLPLAVAQGTLAQVRQFADLESQLYGQSQTAKNLLRDTYEQIVALESDPNNALLISLFGVGPIITNMKDAIAAMGGSYVTGSGDTGLIGQLEAYHDQFAPVAGEAEQLAFLCSSYGGIRTVVGEIYTQADKLYQNASDPMMYSLIISNSLVSGYDEKLAQLKDILKQFDDMLVELDGNRLLVLGDWQADTTGTFCDKVMAASQVEDGYLEVPAGSTLTDGSDDTAATLPLTAQVISVTCHWNDGSGNSTVLQGLAGDSLSAPAEPTRTGFEFGGWYTEESCTGEPYVFTVVPETDLELYAKWTVKQYTITFVTGEGATAVEPITADYGAAVQAPAAPAREGYAFVGWYAEPDYSGTPYTFTTMPAENLTLYAKWQAGQYTIQFDSQGGSAVESIAADYGQPVSAPAEPTRTGYTFGGWYTDAACTGEPYVFTTMPAGSFTLYAKWTVKQYTITFVTGEGATTVEPITADYGAAIQAPAAPTRTGYMFNGWYPELPATMPAEDLVLTARWSKDVPVIHTHEWDEGVTDEKATCVTAGSRVYTCRSCGATKTELIPATGHTELGEWITIQEASCTGAGTQARKCSACGLLVEERSIPALGHDYQLTDTIEAGCENSQLDIYTCSRCGDSYSMAVGEAVGHTVVEDPAVAADCTTEGLTAGSHCSACGAILVKQETVPATGHTYEEQVTDPTCTAKGYTTHICAACGDSYVDSWVPATGHTFSDEPEETTADGVTTRVYHCLYCDAARSETWVEEPKEEQEVTIDNGSASMHIDAAAIKDILAGLDEQLDAEIRINIAILDSEAQLSGSSLDEAVAELVRDYVEDDTSIVVDITIRDELGGDLLPEERNSVGSIQVTLPYTRKWEHSSFQACWAGPDGKMWVGPCQYQDGQVSFTTNHCSTYVVMELCDHILGQFTVVTPATETEDGLEMAVCEQCHETVYRVIPATGGEPTGPSGGGGGGVVTKKYPVELPETVENGTITADSTTAEAGQTVTLTVKPDQGYTLDAITVTDGSGKRLNLTAEGDTYRFTMPEGKVTVAVSFAPVPVELPFTDVGEEDWFYDSVSYVYVRELMTGISDTLFAPDQHLTRGMITTVLWRLEGSPAGTGTVFTDVAEDAWYAQAVRWAAAQGIVEGYGNGMFGPEDDITREQLAAILYRYARYLGDTTKAEGDLSGYPDGAQTSDWAVESMTWAVSTGLISGKNGGLLDPTGTATRSEVAALLQRFCESRAE
ncbi:InlB B-repeat-containing protein [Flavonifractor sp. HCP28S3_F3]|uniref:InlB B-repeat-containing protein n=1 Tax=Flavonifractor sp. HCP28S3_F3 TaxID=3438939 RepID=UPI003F8970FC